ncbi:MAG: hypothetical protein WD894_14455 [Pirellulales bacterium]
MAAPNAGNGAPLRATLKMNTVAGRPSPAAAAKELCLRFVCSRCQHWLSVPIRSMGMIDKCPGCQTVVKIPALDGYVVGLEEVLKARGERQGVVLGCRCPTCQTIVQAAKADYGRPLHCGGCGEWFVLQVQSVDAPHPTKPTATPRKENQPRAAVGTAGGQQLPPPVPPPPSNPPPPPAQPEDDWRRHSPFAVSASSAEDDELPEIDELLAKPSNLQSSRFEAGPRLSPRWARYFFRYGIWWGPTAAMLLIGASSSEPALALFLIGISFVPLWFVVGGLLSRLLTPVILASILRTVRCPGCGDQLPAVGRWSCGCGYHDHRERNVFLFKCPKCSGRVGHIDCPRCDSTILF